MPTRLERLVALKDEIDRGRYPTVEKLCSMFEIQPRTLHDDLRMMRDMMGLEIKHDRSRNGYYNANPGKKLPEFDLTAGEVFALTVAKEMLSEYVGTPFHPILEGAIEKIQQRLPEKVRVDVGDVEAAIHFGGKSASPFSRKMFMDLHRACEKHLCAEIEYLSAYKDELTKRTVEPYKLLAHENTWYLVAFCKLRKDLRHFALHRIKDYSITNDGFVPTDAETLEKWLASAFLISHQHEPVDVSIKFDAHAARYIKEKIWHPTQTIANESDGSCTLSMKCTDLDEVKRWILTYGAEAEVLSPEPLRTAVKQELTKALAKYAQP
jgi:predicted DNA-binding transcriptional regulator YafY